MRSALAMAMLATCAWACAGSAHPRSASPVSAETTGEETVGVLPHLLKPLSDAFVAEGYRVTGPVERGFLAPSSRVVQPIVIAPRVCIAIVALATATVTDLDAAIYAADGAALAEDDTTGTRPIVRLCAGERGIKGYLAFYAFQGTGSFAAQRFERPLGSVDALALAELERDARDDPQTPAFSELLRGLHGRGYEDDGPITVVPLVDKSPVRLAAHVQAGRCYGVVADGHRLRVRLLDGEGREIALGVGATGPAALQYCAHEDADLLLELSAEGPERSARLARLYAGQAEVGSARAVWLGEPSAAAAVSALDAHETAAGDDGQEPKAEAHCSGALTPILDKTALAQGEVVERELKLVGCVQIEAELHEGLAIVTLRIEDTQGPLLAERELRGPRATLRVCAGSAGAQHLSVIARAGFGALSLRRQACGR